MLMERITEKQNDQNELEAKLDAICSDISSLSNSKNKLSKDIQDVQNTVSNIMCPTIGDISEFFDSHQIDLTQQLSPIINTLSQDIILAKESISQKFNNLRNELNQQHINSKIYLKLKLKKIKDQLSELITSTCGGNMGSGISGSTCGGAGWRKVVDMDFSDPDVDCPAGWSPITVSSIRTCGKTTQNIRLSCDSATFFIGGEYSMVCGKIKAYQFDITDGFLAFNNGNRDNIDGAYAAGISLTHGSPREHIWTFVAGASKDQTLGGRSCPCESSAAINIPNFVGNNYFCESGNPGMQGSTNGVLFSDDPLWDGNGCTPTSTCCSFQNPPYFFRNIAPTTDDLEARICINNRNEDIRVEVIEIFVK